MRFEPEVRFNWIRECEQHGGRLNRSVEVLRTGANIEMSRRVAPKSQFQKEMEQHTYLFRSAIREQRPLKAQSLVAVAFNPGLNAYQAQRLQLDSRVKQGEEEQMGWEQAKLAATKIRAE